PSLTPSPFLSHRQNDWIVESDAIENKQTQGFLLLDARAAERFRGEVEPIDAVAGHIPAAVNYPLTDNIENGLFRSSSELNKQFAAVIQNYSADKIIHYCGSGVSACHNILAMEHAGMHGSKLYPGSWSEWIRNPNRSIAKGE
ncbi:MAG: rhodanese-like domain-containing protein, partial [Gammaproteobacteria bacterium]|nr:rhodanese-like domain-containing protein [Gammaproteobacteria bacterium]